jgi:hypothetical protein
MFGHYMLAVVGEYQDFILRRMRLNVDLMQRLRHCKSPDQILAEFRDYWIVAAEDFGKEVTTLTKMVVGIAPRYSHSTGATVPPAPARVIRFPLGKAWRSEH